MDTQADTVAADYNRFSDLTYEGFQRLARDESLSCYQRIGFPDSYRQGHEAEIFADVRAKLPGLDDRGRVVLDVGPGCSELPRLLLAHCEAHNHTLLLSDSPEMLAHLPDGPQVRKYPGRYPRETPQLLQEFAGRVDVLISYSVLHYVFAEQPLFEFLDRSLELLAEGGCLLLGDIPNVSKRKRFFSSAAGIRHHQGFTGSQEVPRVDHNLIEHGKIDDAVVLGIVARCRQAGFDAYVIPQAAKLPMANRREDLLIQRP